MNKQYYKKLFNRCLYRDESGRISSSFMELCKQQENLTFDERYLDESFVQKLETPFLQIQRYDNFIDIDSENSCLDYDEILEKILAGFTYVLRKIKKREKYFFSCSAGSDSRIIMALLAKLRDKEGYNLDNITFHCWGQAEKTEFLELMKKFRFENISILDDTIEDVYDISTTQLCADGWYPYDGLMKFWGNINPAEYTLLSGAEGETLLRPFNEWKHSHGYFSNRGESVHRLANIFNDTFFPYLTKEMLSITMIIPDKFKNIQDTLLDRDKIRTDLCKILHVDDIPMPQSYYNFNFSDAVKAHMKNRYIESAFYKKYQFDLNWDQLFAKHTCHSAKAWTFAVTVYEKLMST